MKKTRGLAILNVITFLIHLSVAYMTQMKVINSKDIGEISNLYPSLFTLPNFSFAIWGIIYAYLGIFCVYHVVMAYKRNWENPANKDLETIGSLFIVNNLVTTAWLIAWTTEKLLISVILIFIQLFTLVLIHIRLHIHSRQRSPGSKIATEFPLSIYLGWISLAAIVNTSSWLASTGWDGFGISDIGWMIIMLTFTILLGIVMVLVRHNIAFGLVMLWGLYGIISKFETAVSQSSGIRLIAWGGISVLGLCIILQTIRSLNYQKQRRTALEGKSRQAI